MAGKQKHIRDRYCFVQKWWHLVPTSYQYSLAEHYGSHIIWQVLSGLQCSNTCCPWCLKTLKIAELPKAWVSGHSCVHISSHQPGQDFECPGSVGNQPSIVTKEPIWLIVVGGPTWQHERTCVCSTSPLTVMLMGLGTRTKMPLGIWCWCHKFLTTIYWPAQIAKSPVVFSRATQS